MNKFFYKITFASILVSFLVNSCSTEDLKNEKNENIAAINKAEEYFNKNVIKLKDNIYFSGTPDWKNASFKNDTILVSLVSDNPVSVKDINNWDKPLYFNSHLLIIKKKYDSTFDYNLKVYFSSDVMSLNINRYHLYDMENRLTSDNGKKPIKSKKSSITSKSNACELWGTFAVDRETGEERLLYTWWQCDGGTRTDEQAPPDGGGGSGPVETTEAIEDYIYDTELDPCTKDILDKLKNLGNGDIAEMLKRFSPDGSVFSINMSTGQVQNNNSNIIWAQTKMNTNTGMVNIVFNQDYINGKDNPNPPTDLSVATTMAHEVIHAYLISLLEDNKICGTSGICDFPTIYEAYVQQEITKNTQILPDAHHNLIAEKYVNAIASTIQEFHTGQQVTSGFPHQVYLDMAWGGLQETQIFNKNYPDDPNHKNYKDRERIFGRINTEKNGSEYGINTPIGTPCKK